MWKEQGRALTVLEQQEVQISKLCTPFGLILIPLYVLMTLVGFIWLVFALKGDSGNNLKAA